jgi:hypothetical protein
VPVRIEKIIGSSREEVAYLCDDDWELPSQVAVFQNWLLTSTAGLVPNEYVADIGFSPREGAAGGGANLNSTVLERMGKLGMSLALSEYSHFQDDQNACAT